jgi:hypothetical protein
MISAPPMTAATIALSNTSPLPEDWFTASKREPARIANGP